MSKKDASKFTAPEWGTEMSLGDDEIDRQHREFLVMAVHATELVEQGTTSQIAAAIANMMAFMKMHFDAEERIFGRTAYPEATAHAVEHRALVNQCNQIVTIFGGSRDLAALRGSLHGLMQAMVAHLVQTDMRYKAYVFGGKASPPPRSAQG